jgi:RNA polymerase sigma factor (sigma-70 family)
LIALTWITYLQKKVAEALIHTLNSTAKNAEADPQLKALIKEINRYTEKLVLGNYGFLVSQLAKGDRDDMDEKFQAGLHGLLRAAETFNPAHGAQFTTFAEHQILSKTQRQYLQKKNSVHIPAHIHQRLRAYRSSKKDFLEKFKREPTKEELAAALNLPVAKIKLLEEILSRKELSLDAPLNGGDESSTRTWGEITADDLQVEEGLLEEMDLTKLRQILEYFPARDRKILDMHFGLTESPKNLLEIAAELNLSRMQIINLLNQEKELIFRFFEEELNPKFTSELTGRQFLYGVRSLYAHGIRLYSAMNSSDKEITDVLFFATGQWILGKNFFDLVENRYESTNLLSKKSGVPKEWLELVPPDSVLTKEAAKKILLELKRVDSFNFTRSQAHEQGWLNAFDKACKAHIGMIISPRTFAASLKRLFCHL